MPIPCRCIAISASSRRGRRLAEEARVAHRLYGHVDAAVNFSAGTGWLMPSAVLAEARAHNRLSIFVGGSGLYFKALTRGLSAVPPIPPEIRESVRARTGTRWRRGAACRTGAARSAIRRAPEVTRSHPHRARARSDRGDRPFADRLASRGLAAAVAAGHEFSALFLAPDRDRLYARIDARFDAMLRAGALEEVAALAARRSRSAAAGDEGPWRAGADPASAGRDHARGGGDHRPRRYPPLRQAAVHLVSASAAGIRMDKPEQARAWLSYRACRVLSAINPIVAKNPLAGCRKSG